MKTNAQRLKELIKTAPIVKQNKIEFNCYQDNYKPVINIKGSDKTFDYSLFCETITNIATENKIYNVHFRGKDNIGKKKEKKAREKTPVIETITTEPQPEQTQETEQIMNTTTTEQKPQDLQQQVDKLMLDVHKRIKLLEYLKQNGINGKIQEATEQEIKELKAEIAKLERPRLEKRIVETKNFIANDTQKLLDATAQENLEDMAFYLNELMGFKQDLERDLLDLQSLKEKEFEAQPQPKEPKQEPKQEERTAPALVLTAPATGDPQNAIPLFSTKKN